MENQNQQNQSPPSPHQTPSPINNSSKSKVIPIIVGVATVIAIAIGAYILGTKQSQPVVQNIAQTTPTPSPIPSIDETANWKTYKNDEYGFEVKHPKNYSIVKRDLSSPFFVINMGENGQIIIGSQEPWPRGETGIGREEILTEVKEETIHFGDITATKTIVMNNGEISSIFIRNFHGMKNDKWTIDAEILIKLYDQKSVQISDQILSTFKFIEQPALPTACKDEPEGTPVILSLSSNFGSIGTKLEIKGCNFSGFEGDKNAWIENSQGVRGILYGQEGSTSKLLKITLRSPLCQVDNSYSGIACDKSLTLIPGVYKIYTMPWGKKSNEFNFTIQ